MNYFDLTVSADELAAQVGRMAHKFKSTEDCAEDACIFCVDEDDDSEFGTYDKDDVAQRHVLAMKAIVEARMVAKEDGAP